MKKILWGALCALGIVNIANAQMPYWTLENAYEEKVNAYEEKVTEYEVNTVKYRDNKVESADLYDQDDAFVCSLENFASHAKYPDTVVYAECWSELLGSWVHVSVYVDENGFDKFYFKVYQNNEQIAFATEWISTSLDLNK